MQTWKKTWKSSIWKPTVEVSKVREIEDCLPCGPLEQVSHCCSDIETSEVRMKHKIYVGL